MFNGLLNSNFDVNDVRSMLWGHHKFLQKNTGETYNAQADHYVLNNEGVLSNNRHFIAASQMEAQPNGDATTEGQSLLIIGYCYAYMATKEQEYLDAAKKYFDAYIAHFYFGQPIPPTPQRYICNWLVNGKEPVLANWPVDFDNPTHSGFKGEMMNFTNGRTQIPHGDKYWGEYLDKSTFAFDGALGWDSIVATVYGLKEDGVTTDWNSKGVQYDVDWVVNYTGKKIDWDGNVLEEVASEPKGTVQLKNTSVNGLHKLNWGNRQPVEHGGFMLERNHPWHNRPLNVPVATNDEEGKPRVGQMGNASDAEQWFADSAYLLYKITGDAKYLNAWQSVLVTVDEYADIDAVDKFFRQDSSAKTPWTDGISYDFQYPSDLPVNYDRDVDGNIIVNVGGAGQNSIEQQAVTFHVDGNSRVRTTISGDSSQGVPINCVVDISIAKRREDAESQWSLWTYSQPVVVGSTPSAQTPKLNEFLQKTGAGGKEFITADERMLAGTYTGVVFEDNVYDGRSAYVASGTNFTDYKSMIIGFWLLESKRMIPHSIVARTNAQFQMEFTDADGWYWHWVMPNTGGTAWSNMQLGSPVLNDYQKKEDMPPGWDERPPPIGNGPWIPPKRPTAPAYPAGGLDQVEVKPTNPDNELATISWYCIDDVPQTYSSSGIGDAYIMKYRQTTRSDFNFVYYIGDCDVLDALESNLYCTPGVIPFSNIYTEKTEQFDGWHGMPYPGYQYPFVWMHHDYDPGNEAKYKKRMENMVEFMYQSQLAYTRQFGVVGPGMSAYIWNRWDNYKYGPPDTWTMYHWGDGTAWSGYQPRAYFGAARTWYELTMTGGDIPPNLIKYVDNWIGWLEDFMVRSGGISPTDFPPASLPQPVPDDFTGHMCGLWLAGSCMAALSGSTNPKLPNLIELLAKELNTNYYVSPIPDHVMNGTWTVAPRLNTGNGKENNGMYFGFYAGEIMRGLGLYMLYKRLGVGGDMYKFIEEV